MSRRSPTTSRSAGTALRGPAARVSKTVTSCPPANSCRTVWLPMYPAPPVTRIRMSGVGSQESGVGQKAPGSENEHAHPAIARWAVLFYPTPDSRLAGDPLRDRHEHVFD